MIITSYATFRYVFSIKARSSGTFTYNNLTPATITRAAGSFTDDGWTANMSIFVTETANNNGVFALAGHPAAGTLTLAAGQTLTTETVASVVEGKFMANDGMETWPLAKSSVWSGNMQWPPGGSVSLPDVLTVNGLGEDAVYGVDEWDWYLSQRTDDPAKQYFSLTQEIGMSGTVTLDTTALFDDMYPDGFSPQAVQEVFKNVDLYVQKRSDKGWARFNLFEQYTREAEPGGA